MDNDTPVKQLFGGGKKKKKAQKQSLVPEGMKGGVFYIRVSTDKQGESGLGLEAQREMLAKFKKDNNIYQIGETFEEIGSGGGGLDKRPELKKAIELAREYGAFIVVTKLDRLSRRAAMISNFLDGDVKFVTQEYGFGAKDLILRIIAAWGQEERELISERTKLALQQKKKQFEEDYQKQIEDGVENPVKKRLGIPSVANAPTHVSHLRRKEGLERKRYYYEKYILPTKLELEREYPKERITRKRLADRMQLKGYKTKYGHPFSESVIYHTLKDLNISLRKSKKSSEEEAEVLEIPSKKRYIVCDDSSVSSEDSSKDSSKDSVPKSPKSSKKLSELMLEASKKLDLLDVE